MRRTQPWIEYEKGTEFVVLMDGDCGGGGGVPLGGLLESLLVPGAGGASKTRGACCRLFHHLGDTQKKNYSGDGELEELMWGEFGSGPLAP